MLTQTALGLTADQIQSFEENGYIHLRGALEPWELAALDRDSKAIIDYARDLDTPPNDDYQYKVDPATGKKVLHRINRMYLKSDYFFAAWAQPRIMAAEASLYDANVMTGDDAIVIKMPDYGILVPWHGAQNRDKGKAWSIPPVINAGIYLDDATPESGCLWLIPGSFRWEGLDPQEWVDRHGFYLPGAIPVPAKAGDVILHREDLWHGSPTTRGGGYRRVFYVALGSPTKIVNASKDPNVLKTRLSIFQKARQVRARLPESATEPAYTFAPTMPDLQSALQNPTFVDLIQRR